MGSLSFRLYFKPTSQHIPLSQDSGHSPAVHRSWPKAEIGRIARRSSSEVAFNKAKNQLCDRWQSNFMDSTVVTHLRTISFSDTRCCKPATRDGCRHVWLVLPYNPCWCHSELFNIITSLESKWQSDVACVFRSMWRLRIRWKHSARNLLSCHRAI